MDLKYQFNKTSLHQLNRELAVRLEALPTLHAKESALRAEVKRAKDAAQLLKGQIEEELSSIEFMSRLWVEFPDILMLKEVKVTTRNIAGVKIPQFNGLSFKMARFSLFGRPSWLLSGVEILKGISELRVKHKIVKKELAILEYARKKTTQKVNLYEKVQVPAFDEAIQRIKRFLEDEENLAMASQKILKAKKARRAACQ
ncbi:MAG: V-type ATP synthase subunit D [bacterium]|nr:V-type ATP synthase subunit D [bacterium]